ncbi:MAG: hypothetical protein OHK0038_16800 [Flammeovirgaceae bacterium]
MRSFINLRNFGGVVFVFGFMWVLGKIGVSFEFLNVFEQVFEDFKLTDIYYSKIRDNTQEPFEDDIVLVNIGDAKLGRRVTAQQINILSQYKPKVIGMDARFFYPKEDDPIGDFQLAQAFKNAGNVILGSEAAPFDHVNYSLEELSKITAWDTLYRPIPMFLEHVQTGHVNTGLPNDDFVTWSDFPIVERIKNGHVEPCLAAKILENYNKEAYERLIARVSSEDRHEQIFFKGNLDKYVKLDVEDVLQKNFDSTLITGKIVLIGYLGGEYTDYHFDEDKFYTPLNPKQMGRGAPDMYGVVVHANIISMALDNKFINEMPEYLSWIIAILVCYVNVALFSWIVTHHKFAVWYNAISKSIQLIEAISLYFLNVFLFANLNYQADLTVTIFVIVLSGDLAEIYVDVFLNFIRKIRSKVKPVEDKPVLNI